MLALQLITQSPVVSRVPLKNAHKTTKGPEKAWEYKRIFWYPLFIP